MTQQRFVKRSGYALGAATLAFGTALAAAPIASAERQPVREVPMAYPGEGDHRVLFGARTGCHWAEGKGISPAQQSFNASARDLDIAPPTTLLDINRIFPFNSILVEWHNHGTGESGAETAFSVGGEVGIPQVNTDFGDVTAKITVTRSALPTFSAGSAAPFASATHTEVLELDGEDAAWCEGPIDAPHP